MNVIYQFLIIFFVICVCYCTAEFDALGRKRAIKALSTLSQKSATVAENGETTATVAEFGDSRTFMRQCGQALRTSLMSRNSMSVCLV